jgi:hypothetical protein
MASSITLKALSTKNLADNKADWKLLYFGLKVVNIEKTFGNGDKEFDFKNFFDEYEAI